MQPLEQDYTKQAIQTNGQLELWNGPMVNRDAGYRPTQAFVHTIYRQPSPSSGHSRVQIGDVGYIRDGGFRFLFNAAKPDGPVPDGFVPLKIGDIHNNQPRKRGLLWARSINLLGAAAGSDL